MDYLMPTNQIFFLVICSFLTACVTVEDMDREEKQRFDSFIGLTMAEFMQRTLVTPYNYFDTNEGRVFIADKRAPDPRFGCTMHISAKRNERGTNADGWTITSISRQGGCRMV